MQNNEAEYVLVVLREKLNALSRSLSDCCIYRVHNELREVNTKVYEPVLVSIGPYHRYNDKYQMIKEYKLRCLRQIVQGTGTYDDSLEYYFSEMRSLVEESRKYYAETVELNDDEFAEMLLLDSCFVVEVIREFCGERPGEYLFRKLDWMVSALQRDLMLFENQLPFFVILKMFDLIEGGPNGQQLFIRLAYRFFAGLFNDMGVQSPIVPPQPQDGIKHLLGMIHDIFPQSYLGQGSKRDVANTNKLRFIPCASNLIEAGVKFEKAEGRPIFDITYKNGVISIPSLIIDDRTECFLRNLIAYEQYKVGSSRLFVTDYVVVLDRLINTSKDVEILSKWGVVDSWLGEDEVVSNLFNKIGDSVLVSDNFHYAGLCNQVNAYYNKKRNRWMAKLKRNYLNSPWAVISVAAAIILLGLTVAQTVAAFLSI